MLSTEVQIQRTQENAAQTKALKNRLSWWRSVWRKDKHSEDFSPESWSKPAGPGIKQDKFRSHILSTICLIKSARYTTFVGKSMS